jgi:hypothetical protein
MGLRRTFPGLFVAMLMAVAAPAADKRFPLEGGDTLVINAGADWVAGAVVPDSPFGTLTIQGPDKTVWQLTLAPLPPHPTLTGDAGNLRIYVRNMARAIENDGAQVEQEQKALDGAHARGFYFKARDTRTKTRQQIKQAGGEFTDAYTGALSIDSRAYLFQVLWNKGGETPANAALAALKTVRIQ